MAVKTAYPVKGGGVWLPLRGDMVVSNLFRVKLAMPTARLRERQCFKSLLNLQHCLSDLKTV